MRSYLMLTVVGDVGNTQELGFAKVLDSTGEIMGRAKDELQEFTMLSHKYELILTGLFNDLQSQRDAIRFLETKVSDLTSNVAQLRQRGQLLRVSLVVSVAALAVSVAALFSAFS